MQLSLKSKLLPRIELHVLYVSWQPFSFDFCKLHPQLPSTSRSSALFFHRLCLSIKVMVVFALMCGGTTRTQNFPHGSLSVLQLNQPAGWKAGALCSFCPQCHEVMALSLQKYMILHASNNISIILVWIRMPHI